MNQNHINRRAFIKKTIEYAACATLGMAGPWFQENAIAIKQGSMTAVNELLKAVEASDVAGANRLLKKNLVANGDAWKIHLALYPVVQQVLNPPYINPHLPKMYAIYREFVPYLQENETAAMVQLEVTEYARRPKLQKLPKAKILNLPVAFNDIEAAIKDQDREKTAILMATFQDQNGGEELARKLLLLGSGYLDQSLGHSISCTAFILREMLQRADQDAWPALTSLAEYFCKGKFHDTPPLSQRSAFSDEAIRDHLLRAASGRGIVTLHHTITLYAIERVKQFFSAEEYHHMIGTWIEFLENKQAQPITLASRDIQTVPDYARFYKIFSSLEPESATAAAVAMMGTPQSRRQLSHFLIRSICDMYQGDYNPHNLTGLGSVLWVVEHCWNQAPIAQNALFQYLDFFFDDIKSKK
jgi:hypothetical protein